jgi:methylglutaconyl-CoA hydratase
MSLIQVTDIPALHTGRIRILSLNRPKAKNAISWALLRELIVLVKGVAAEYDHCRDENLSSTISVTIEKTSENVQGPTRVVILASEVAGCFCAGADLKERFAMTKEEWVFNISLLLLYPLIVFLSPHVCSTLTFDHMRFG